jgi:hypothetical protein
VRESENKVNQDRRRLDSAKIWINGERKGEKIKEWGKIKETRYFLCKGGQD